MDPVLFIFLTSAAVAIITLATAHLSIYKIQWKPAKDCFTQIDVKNYRTAGTHTQPRKFKTLGSQVPEKKRETNEQGCDASIIPYGVTATDQIKEFW